MLKGYNRYEVSASANAQSFAAKTHRVEANVPGMGMGGMGGMGGSGGFGGTASAIKGFFDKLVMEGIIMDKDAAAQRRMARDMYRYDAVCGGAVDLMALLPWSNATLSGVADKKILEKYQTCVQSMNMMMLMPEATVDHLVNAQFIGSMQWDANESTFIGIAPQDPEQCTFQHVPFYGKDPLISLKFSDGFKQLVEAAKKDPRAAKMLSENAPNLASQLARKEIPLDPDTTVYVPRRTFASQIEPTSFLTRAMPVWIIEKALMRGTIELSYKRQRSIMHILLGGEDWEPTVEEATNYVNLFQAADSDPTSAIIATRPDVLVTEVRCLAGNSLVHTQTGLRAIDSLVEHDKHGEPFSVELNDVRVKGFDGKFVDVKEWHFHGTKPTFKITTSSGNELIATCNHKFFTTFEGELKFKKTSDMLGQYVLTPMLQAETKGTRDLSNIEYTVYQNRKDNIDITIPKRMTPELAYAMGLVVSEGYMNRKSIQVTNTNMDVLNKYVACMAASFERKPSIRVTKEKGNSTFRYIDRSYRRRTYTTKPCYSAELSSMEIVSFLEGLGVKRSIRKKKSPAYYKRIPHAILQADRECRLAFMAAYIQGDGNIARKENNSKLAVEIKFFSRSVKILRSLKTMLADMGYRSTFSRKFYNLYLPTCDASKLYNELNSYMLEDKAHYTYCDDVRARQLGIPADVFIPFLKSRFVRRQTQKKDGTPSGSFFINDDGEKVFIAGGWGNTFRHYLRANSYLMYDKFDDNGYRDELNIIKRVSKKLYATLMTLFKLRYRFDKVVSVKPHKDLPVYDLTIRTPGMPAFMVNGVVGHNSASDFWRYDEIMEATSAFKYRALGFNESFLCLTGDSLVKSENGLLRIDSISGDRENSPIKKGFDIDLQVAGRFKKETAAKWLYSGFAPTLKITAENGQQLKGTKKHPALVLNQFDTEWVELNNLRVGDLLCVDTKPFTRKAPLNLDLEDPEVHPQSRNLISPYKPKRMTPDLAFAMGLVVAEGCVDDYRVRMCNSNDELIAVYRKKIKDVFRLTCNLSARSTAGDYIETFDSVCTKTVYDVCCNSKTLSDWFQQLGVSRSRSKNGKTHSYYKHVPWSILEADEQSQLAYIAAYVEGDGSIQDNGSAITLFSRSMKNLRQMQALLNAHGILASVRRHKKAGRLQLTKENSLNLYRKIEPYLITKKVSTIHETIYHDRKFGIPTKDLKTFLEKRFVRWETNVGGVLLNDEGKEIVIPNWGQYFSRVVTTCKYMLYANYREGLYDEFLSRLRIVSKTVHEKIVTLLKLEYQFIPVTEIKKNGRQHVYDLSMKPGVEPAFVANGFVVHNTGDANFNTMENALSTFLERLKYLRFVMSQRIFYNKIFPYIAKQNDFKIKGDPKPIEVTGYYEDNVIYSTDDRRFPNYSLFSRGVDTLYCRSQGYVEIGSERFNPAQYHIPHLSYVKALKPEADSAYLDIMKTMEEKGIPIPLQMWASASGFNINEVMRGYDDDIKYRKAINAYLKKMPKSAMKKESDEDGAFEEASFREHMIAALAKDGPIGLGRRKFTDRDNEMRDPDTRKVLSRRGRAVRLERLHKNGAEAMTRIAARENRGVNERIQAAAQRLHTYAGLNIPVPKSVAAMEKSARMKRSHIIRAASL